jgi:hypothetical protein
MSVYGSGTNRYKTRLGSGLKKDNKSLLTHAEGDSVAFARTLYNAAASNSAPLRKSVQPNSTQERSIDSFIGSNGVIIVTVDTKKLNEATKGPKRSGEEKVKHK